MKLNRIQLRNFRRLEDVCIDFEEKETIFVGPNNSGKTSATIAFRLFLKNHKFKIYDFSASKISDIDSFGTDSNLDEEKLPSIEMDMWFSIDGDTEFGRAFSLIPNLTSGIKEVGIRIKYSIKDLIKMKSEYSSRLSELGPEDKHESLSYFLSQNSNFSQNFSLKYFALEADGKELNENHLEPDEGRRILQALIRVDFVDAQRNIEDHEVTNTSNRLSTAFSLFYKRNLKQADRTKEANKVILENNENLNKHYNKHFKGLMSIIQGLGVPSVNDRKMKIVSTLNAEDALRGNTELLYVDSDIDHELPEAYNGLGFKNLVYIIIQISDFYLQWMNTEKKRPLCQIVFVEEPEVHLHAQAQQTFISNVWSIITKLSIDAKENNMIPQLVVTTHSSHILDAVDFLKIRYFKRRTPVNSGSLEKNSKNISEVLNLRKFKPNKKSADGKIENEDVTLKFLKRYLKLTHCDLFFADAAILIEGTVEKLLLPEMISKSAPGLQKNYLTILEVGGAYAHRFSSLIQFLGIHYIVITDLDSVDPNEHRKTCRADNINSVTSNASIKFYLDKEYIDELIKLNSEDQILEEETCYVAFQKATTVKSHSKQMIGRTFEETFVYENIQLFRNGDIKLFKNTPSSQDYEKEYKMVFDTIKSDSFKKTEFALDVASSTSDWVVPSYIADGLRWLEKQISHAIIKVNN